MIQAPIPHTSHGPVKPWDAKEFSGGVMPSGFRRGVHRGEDPRRQKKASGDWTDPQPATGPFSAVSTAGVFQVCRRLLRGNSSFGESCRSRQIFPRVL